MAHATILISVTFSLRLSDLVRVYVALNVDHSAGADCPRPRLYNIVVLISSKNAVMVKFVRKSLLGSSPHDVVTRKADPLIAHVIGWSLY